MQSFNLLYIILIYVSITVVIMYSSQPDIMRAAQKLMPLNLLCWPTTSEANVVDMAVEVEPSRQYYVIFCCRATDDSRGAV